MNTIQNKISTFKYDIIAALAITLAVLQNGLFLSSLADLIDMKQIFWLVINSAEIALLIYATRTLRLMNKRLTLFIYLVIVYLCFGVICENFIMPMGYLFWIINSGLITLSLFLASFSLIKNFCCRIQF